MRRRWPQLLRRSLQLGVIALVIYAALGGPWRNYKLAHNHRRLVGLIEGPMWAALYGLNEDALSLVGEPAEVSLGFLGFPFSARVFGLESADPSMVLAHTIQTRTLRSELWTGLVAPLLLALVLGKVFCSHLCPMRLLFELGQGVRRGLERLGVELPEVRSCNRWGGWVLAGGLLATLASSTVVWLIILPYASFGASLFLLVTTGMLSGLAAVVVGWWLLDLLVAPGYFCHNLCPTGFLLETVSRFSLLRLRKTGTACPPSCDLCHRTCPYGLEPALERHHPACDNCGRCAMVCPGQRLVRRIGGAVVAGSIALMLAPPAHAHHNKGLPHYGYFENYPQVPTEEYIDFVGRWEIGATIFNFQGLDRRSADTPNDVKIFLYLYDLEADQGYTGPLTVEIRHRGEVVSRFDRLQVDEEAVYSTRETLPASGNYELVAFVEESPLAGPQEPSVEPVPLRFHVDLSADRIRWGLIASLVAPLTAVFGLALFGRRRRRRRRLAAKPLAEARAS